MPRTRLGQASFPRVCMSLTVLAMTATVIVAKVGPSPMKKMKMLICSGKTRTRGEKTRAATQAPRDNFKSPLFVNRCQNMVKLPMVSTNTRIVAVHRNELDELKPGILIAPPSAGSSIANYLSWRSPRTYPLAGGLNHYPTPKSEEGVGDGPCLSPLFSQFWERRGLEHRSRNVGNAQAGRRGLRRFAPRYDKSFAPMRLKVPFYRPRHWPAKRWHHLLWTRWYLPHMW